MSPLNPEGAAIEAGRLMLQRIDYLLNKDESFSIETTLATRSYIKLVEKAHQRGFVVNLLFFWLPSPELASIRVTERVMVGTTFLKTQYTEDMYWEYQIYLTCL